MNTKEIEVAKKIITLPSAMQISEEYEEDINDCNQNLVSNLLLKNKFLDYRLKTVYGNLLFIATLWWIILLTTILFLQGFAIINLDTSIINVLLTTTTASIIGLPYIVVNYLFK